MTMPASEYVSTEGLPRPVLDFNSCHSFLCRSCRTDGETEKQSAQEMLSNAQSLSSFILTRGACVGGGTVNHITLLGRVRGSKAGTTPPTEARLKVASPRSPSLGETLILLGAQR